MARLAAGENDLATRFPDLASQWHPSRNGSLLPTQVTAGSAKKVWWRCAICGHEWPAIVASRALNGRGCPACARQVVVPGRNDLTTVHLGLAAEWHPGRNGGLLPTQVTAGSDKKVWWRCANCGHEWPAKIADRERKGNGCPACAGQVVVPGRNDLSTSHPELAAEWHSSHNADLLPIQVSAGSHRFIVWRCSTCGHEWPARIASRALKGDGCPACAGRVVIPGRNDLVTTHPDLAAEWHPIRNGDLLPTQVSAGPHKKVWWRCANCGHEWPARIADRALKRSGCPVCVSAWTPAKIARFATGILPYAAQGNLLATEVDAIAAAAGMSPAAKQRLIAQIRSRRLQGIEDQDVPVDTDGGGDTDDPILEDGGADELGTVGIEELPGVVDGEVDNADEQDGSNTPEDDDDPALQKLRVEKILRAGGVLAAVDDAETAEFLLQVRVAMLWQEAYKDLSAVEAGTSFPRENHYEELIRRRFRDELEAAIDLDVPAGWSFAPEGTVVHPNLMQRHVAALVRQRRFVGNWSGTGAGKTLSAVLAARTVEAGCNGGLVVVVCPNNTVDGWVRTITSCFPHSSVDVKTFTPSPHPGEQRWLVVNFERFSAPDAIDQLDRLLQEHRVDMLVVDEVHFAKARAGTAASKRRSTITRFRSKLQAANPTAKVLVMSATPVVNELHEARSMLELLSGEELAELPVRHTVSNAFGIHRRLVTDGLRWMPDYSHIALSTRKVPIDVGHLLDDLLALGRTPTPLDYEAVLIDAKLEHIVAACLQGGKSLVYTEFVTGVVDKLTEALEAAGLRVGQFTGPVKEMERFVGADQKAGTPISEDDQVDVLIGSSAVGTGVDGLQHHASRLVFATLPWTAAAYEQVLGRVWRQGRPAGLGGVEVVIPLTYLDEPQDDGSLARWSWCAARLALITNKRTLSDAVVDGVLPSGGVLASPAKVASDVAAWLARLVGETHRAEAA
jgi:DNA-directed RNA polymerase subunit RPC12/RpoP